MIKFSKPTASEIFLLKILQKSFLQPEYCSRKWSSIVIATTYRTGEIFYRGQLISYYSSENIGKMFTSTLFLEILEKIFLELEFWNKNRLSTYILNWKIILPGGQEFLTILLEIPGKFLFLSKGQASSRYSKTYAFNLNVVAKNDLVVTYVLYWWTLILEAMKFLECFEEHQ